MAKRTTRGTVGAAIVLALAAVTACGGGDDSADDDGIAGVETSTPTGAPEEDEEDDTAADDQGRPDDGIERPAIPETDQFTLVFDGWSADDPERNAVLLDARERIRAVHAAVLEGDAEADYLSFYSSGDALRSGIRWVEGFLQKDLTLVGTARFFDPVAERIEGGAYEVTYCADESAGDTKPRDQEEWDEPTGSGEVLVEYRTTLNVTEEGVWQTTLVITGEGC